jgi:hypothetical protein
MQEASSAIILYSLSEETQIAAIASNDRKDVEITILHGFALLSRNIL